MGNFRYISGNLLDSANNITPSSEDSTYPKANLYNQRVGKFFKFTAKTGTIIIDFSNAQSANSIAILNHNLTSSATITMEGNQSNWWASPSKSVSITWRDKDIYTCFVSGSYRYWRLVISDTGNSDNIRIGEFILETYTQLSEMYGWGKEDADNYINIVDKTEYQQSWTYKLTTQKRFRLNFKVNDTTRADLITLIEAVEGSYSPFVFIPNSDDTDCYYVRMGNVLARRLEFTNYNIVESLILTEEPVGKVLGVTRILTGLNAVHKTITERPALTVTPV